MYGVFDMILFLVIIWLAAIISHEYAHKRVFKALGRDVAIKWYKCSLQVGDENDYKGLKNKELYKIYISGVLLGLVPIILGYLFINSIMLMAAIPYIAWSWHDLEQAWKVRK